MSELKAYVCGGWCCDKEAYLKDEADKVIAHHKHKRCLAMARWCESEAYIHEHGSDYDEDLVAWFGKWYKRWIELAEKFKEDE